MAKFYKVTFTVRACRKVYGYRMDVQAFSAKDAIAKVYNHWHKDGGDHMFRLHSTPMKKDETITYPTPTEIPLELLPDKHAR